MKVFIDTSAIIALYYEEDQNHEKAKTIASNLSQPRVEICTTDYIFDEVYTGLINNPKAGYKAVVKFDRRVEKGVWKVIQVNQVIFQQAREVFLRYNKDKVWSFTDCTSYVVMKAEGIRRAFTFDEDFDQMGFWLLKAK